MHGCCMGLQKHCAQPFSFPGPTKQESQKLQKSFNCICWALEFDLTKHLKTWCYAQLLVAPPNLCRCCSTRNSVTGPIATRLIPGCTASVFEPYFTYVCLHPWIVVKNKGKVKNSVMQKFHCATDTPSAPAFNGSTFMELNSHFTKQSFVATLTSGCLFHHIRSESDQNQLFQLFPGLEWNSDSTWGAMHLSPCTVHNSHLMH